MDNVIKIETKNLIIRPMARVDIDDFYEIFSDQKVGQFIPMMTKTQVGAYFEKNIPSNQIFAVCHKKDNKTIGTITLKEKAPQTRTLSYVFNSKYWGNGYATESVFAVLSQILRDSDIHKILADCQFDNFASKAILQKLGFTYLYSNEQNISHLTQQQIKFDFYELNKNDLKNPFLDKKAA